MCNQNKIARINRTTKLSSSFFSWSNDELWKQHKVIFGSSTAIQKSDEQPAAVFIALSRGVWIRTRKRQRQVVWLSYFIKWCQSSRSLVESSVGRTFSAIGGRFVKISSVKRNFKMVLTELVRRCVKRKERIPNREQELYFEGRGEAGRQVLCGVRFFGVSSHGGQYKAQC